MSECHSGLTAVEEREGKIDKADGESRAKVSHQRSPTSLPGAGLP